MGLIVVCVWVWMWRWGWEDGGIDDDDVLFVRAS